MILLLLIVVVASVYIACLLLTSVSRPCNEIFPYCRCLPLRAFLQMTALDAGIGGANTLGGTLAATLGTLNGGTLGKCLFCCLISVYDL